MVGKTISHYKIIERIGGGGMGVVYKAEDTKLKRHVALKFLPHEFTDDPIAKKRFIREAQSASSLDHSNIYIIHEIDETEDGQLFIAMAYYQGETLKRKIQQGPLDIKQAIKIAMGVAEGLAKAHSEGIVHRDIKPANIFLTSDGGVKMLDFGLAKLAATTRITKTESITGTVAYMSPEMVRAEDMDHRTDIWSLGVVLYEMLTSQLPFKGKNWEAIMYAISNTAPIPVVQLRKEVPSSLERIIGKMLQKKPQDRHKDIQEVITDLKSIDLEAKKPSRFTVVKPSASIVVLPFIDMSPAKDQEYFCDGIAEELINSLTHIKDLRVVARTSAFSFKGQETDVRDIGRTLNVDHILEGSVRKAGNKLRITAQLVNVVDGFHLWSERFDSEDKDVFAIQDEISLKIVDKLRVRILGNEKESLKKRLTTSIEAYNSYLQGHFLMQKLNEADLWRAIRYYEKAIEQDPDFAGAYAVMAIDYCLLGLYFYAPSKDVFPKAKIAATKALERDESLAIAHGAMGDIHMLYDWDFDSSRQRIERAMELDPNNASIRTECAGYFAVTGSMEKAIEHQKRALELDPLSVVCSIHLGLFYLRARRVDEAQQHLRKTLDFSPDHPWALWLLATSYAVDARYDKCIELLNNALHISRDHAPLISALGWACAMAGKREEAERILNELHEKAKKSYIRPFFFAKIYAALGNNDDAFQWLERAYQERDSSLAHLLTDESVDCIRDDPRFNKLLGKIGLYKFVGK